MGLAEPRHRPAAAEPAGPGRGQSLAGRVVRGGLWLGALHLTAQLLGAVRLLVLARLLTPHDFGVVGIALVALSLLEGVCAPGIQLALIQRPERTRDLLDTGWTLGLLRAGCVTGLLVALAPAVGRFFDAPEAVPILRVMALFPLLVGLSNIGMVEVRAELTYAPYYVQHVGGVIADLCVAVPLAVWLGNAWALVGGWLALGVARASLSYALHPYRPRLRLNRGAAKALLGFGRWVFVATAVGWLLTDGVQAAVGRLLGVQPLGLYQMASRVAVTPMTQLSKLVADVTVGAYAKLQVLPDRLGRAYIRVLTGVAVVAVPMAMGIGLYAEDLVRILLGARWAPMVPALQVLAVLGILRSIGATAAPLFQGIGRPSVHAMVTGLELGLLAVLLAPLTLRFGPVGTALAATGGCAGGTVAAVVALGRLVGVRPGTLAAVLGGPLLASLPAAALRLLVGPLESLAGLAGAVTASGVLYFSGLLMADRVTRGGVFGSTVDAIRYVRDSWRG